MSGYQAVRRAREGNDSADDKYVGQSHLRRPCTVLPRARAHTRVRDLSLTALLLQRAAATSEPGPAQRDFDVRGAVCARACVGATPRGRTLISEPVTDTSRAASCEAWRTPAGNRGTRTRTPVAASTTSFALPVRTSGSSGAHGDPPGCAATHACCTCLAAAGARDPAGSGTGLQTRAGSVSVVSGGVNSLAKFSR